MNSEVDNSIGVYLPAALTEHRLSLGMDKGSVIVAQPASQFSSEFLHAYWCPYKNPGNPRDHSTYPLRLVYTVGEMVNNYPSPYQAVFSSKELVKVGEYAWKRERYWRGTLTLTESGREMLSAWVPLGEMGDTQEHSIKSVYEIEA